MKLVVLIGPPAVGKMTVGQELERITGVKLFHNHMTIDLVANFFHYGTAPGQRLVDLFRKEIFEEVSKSNLAGLIFTYMWNFDDPEDKEYLDQLCAIFESKGAEIYFVELEADIPTRLERNKSPHRLQCKPTKRDTETSEKYLLDAEKNYRLNSTTGEIKMHNYLRINNTTLSAEEVARKIKETFKF